MVRFQSRTLAGNCAEVAAKPRHQSVPSARQARAQSKREGACVRACFRPAFRRRLVSFVTPPPINRGAEYCVSAIISSELLVRSSPNVVCLLPMAVARSSSGGVVIHYVLPVLWMTSYLLISQGCSMLHVTAQLKRSAHAVLGLAVNCVQ